MGTAIRKQLPWPGWFSTQIWPPIKPTIAFEDFEKLDIRVGTVLECEAVPKMKKLLKFKIADGLENRTIVSGIAQHYLCHDSLPLGCFEIEIRA